MITLDNYKNPKLKVAVNKREITPRCCGACAYGCIVNGFFLCRRENGWEGDAGDGKQWFHVCDGFVKFSHSSTPFYE